MLSITVPGVTANTDKPFRKRDPLCKFDNDGVRFLFDAAFRWCYAAGTALGNKVVKDMAERQDSSLIVRATQSIPLTGNGLDFSGTTLPGNYVEVPAAVMADLQADQQFLICMYMTTPSSDDWPAAANAKALFQGSSNSNSFAAAPDMAFIGFGAAAKSLSFRRQTAVGAASSLVISPSGPGFGQFTQIAFWRNATEMGARMKTVGGQAVATAAPGANNTADCSAALGGFGLPLGFWSYNGFDATELAANNFRLHRGFIENLKRSGRDVYSVLDADWQRQIDRGVFS